VTFIFVVASFAFTANFLFWISSECTTTTCYFPIPTIPLVLLGLYISATDSLTYPTFPIFLQERKLGTAFGGALICQNIALTIGPAVAGYLLDDAPNYNIGYKRVSFFLMMSSAIGMIFIAILYWLEKKKGSRLQKVHDKFDPPLDDDEEIADEEQEKQAFVEDDTVHSASAL